MSYIIATKSAKCAKLRVNCRFERPQRQNKRCNNLYLSILIALKNDFLCLYKSSSKTKKYDKNR